MNKSDITDNIRRAMHREPTQLSGPCYVCKGPLLRGSMLLEYQGAKRHICSACLSRNPIPAPAKPARGVLMPEQGQDSGGASAGGLKPSFHGSFALPALGDHSKDYDHQTDSPLPHPKPERHQTPALGTAGQREKESVGRVVVRFVGYRVRPLDPDNFAGSVKDLLDGLRHARLIAGDEAWRIRLETEQVQVHRFKDERTEISISYP